MQYTCLYKQITCLNRTINLTITYYWSKYLPNYWSDSWRRHILKGVFCCVDGDLTAELVWLRGK